MLLLCAVSNEYFLVRTFLFPSSVLNSKIVITLGVDYWTSYATITMYDLETEIIAIIISAFLQQSTIRSLFKQ